MKKASVYKRKGEFIVSPTCKTTQGVGIGSLPIIKVSEEDGALVLGRAVQTALESSRQGVPHPRQDEWPKILEPLLQSVGVRSWAAFARNAKSVDITLDTNEVLIVPMRNLGPKKGFVWIEEKSRSCPPVDGLLGAAVEAAFEDAE